MDKKKGLLDIDTKYNFIDEARRQYIIWEGSKRMKTKYHVARCVHCGKEIKNQHPDTKDKWVYFKVGNIGYYSCAECEKKEVKRMKAEVIRSGDKNFEEEKAKMFEPKTLNKEEQLGIVFKKILQKHFVELVVNVTFLDDLTNELLTEVKIRTKL